MKSVKGKHVIEIIEEGEFIPHRSPGASVESSMNAHDVIWHGQSPFDWSKSSNLLENMARGSGQTTVKEAENVTSSGSRDSAREKVISTIRLYREICRQLEREKPRARKEGRYVKRIDFLAAKEVKRRAGYVHGGRQFIGDVPGVEVGDKFRYRMELAIVGLHRPLQGGIDCMGTRPDMLATSVVASWDYEDDLTNPDELIYLGQGGRMPGRDKEAEDQTLTQGNLALANSMKRNKPVRVIRKDCDGSFIYDGLYVVDRFQKTSRVKGKMVFEFRMKRLPGQPEIHQKKKMEVHKSSGLIKS
ncbi:histone-lysine N-methyltransferase, H3 lysine-9 specific SUVH6-like [Eucalyptus grandis]|uniref:histone-lysine N-methyltransferase, H3 lysine-9 specific SUVH6-like n=1 Tax=Eucalyptus grandis TaxID=71139 RepID=UPI00192EFBD8|nr:histone-lysine N-methyltransferase, H3 lysine-9 specific SUVH6-like [Eucalyptus grandis]